MAEFLIYDKDHWMDKLNQEEYNKLMSHPHGAEKFLSRYQRGDIVEVREDGFYTSTLTGDLSRWAFRVVIIPGLKSDKKYMQSTETKRRRYAISVNDGVVTTRATINDVGLQDKELLVG